MNKEKLEGILEDMLSTGGNFAEIFIENKKTTVFSFVNQILDSYQVGFSNGLGLTFLTFCLPLIFFSSIVILSIINFFIR